MLGGISIRGFDCHLTLDALHQPDGLRPEFAWLADPAAHARQLFADPAIVNGLRLESWSDLHRHPFWARFRNAGSLVASSGTMLMPARCRPTLQPTSLRSGMLARQATLGRAAWLWPFGWSSELRLHVRQPITLDDLGPLVKDFTSGLQNGTPTSGGTPATTTLSRVFQAIGERLKTAVWSDGAQPYQSRKLERFIVVTVVTDRQDTVRRFDRRPRGALLWPDAERAKVYSLVCNEPVQPSDIARLKGRTMFVDLYAGSFVLLDLTARRALVYLTVARRPAGKWLECVEANLVDFLRQGLMLSFATEELQNYTGGKPLVAELGAAGAHLLRKLADSYASPFARKLVEVKGWDKDS